METKAAAELQTYAIRGRDTGFRIAMPYTLHRLAAGSYDLLLDGEIVASVVRDISDHGHVRNWQAELLSDTPPLPAPFTKAVHCFKTLEEAVDWLDDISITIGS